MRNSAIIVFVVILLSVIGCVHHPRYGGYWTGHSALSNRGSIATLNVTANSQSSSPTDRGRAICRLFAYHLRPGCSAADVRLVLTDTRWLQATNLYVFNDLLGWLPLEMPPDTTAYSLVLDGGYSICFSLTGADRSAADGLAFLRGDAALAGNPKMVEFALGFPSHIPLRGAHGARYERFSEQGIYVFPE